MIKIIVYAESKGSTLTETTYELISKADTLKKQALELNNADTQITTVLVGDEVDENSIKRAYKTGSDKFVLIENELFKDFNQTNYALAFVDFYQKNPHDVILFPATYRGRLVAPRVTTMLDTGLVADCTGIDFILKDNKLKLASTRPTFGSQLMATILSKKTPECATVRPKTFPAIEQYEKQGEYEKYTSNITFSSKTTLLKSKDQKTNSFSFDGAKVVFCAGFGLYEGKNSKYIEKLKKLAKKFNAHFGATRKLVDFGICSHEEQIGQTGSSISPEIYVGFGVSGAIQHIQGMKNSKTIIAINKDENAEIFNYSDYKITTDAKKIIDELLEN